MMHRIWILSVLYCIPTYFLFFRALLPLQHICYYFNQLTPYLWTLTFSIVCYLQDICCSQDRWNCDHSRLSFDYILYSSKNMVRCCVFVVYIHKGKCTTLILILLRFGLLHRYNIQANTGWLFYSPTLR